MFAPTTMIPASAYPKFNSFLTKKISAAEAGSTLSVNADPWTSINKAVADAFTEKGDIGLAIKYTQGGVPLQVTIPAGTNLSEQLDENGYIGFPKLAQLYGAAPVTETATASKETATRNTLMAMEAGAAALNAGNEGFERAASAVDMEQRGNADASSGGFTPFAGLGGSSMRAESG